MEKAKKEKLSHKQWIEDKVLQDRNLYRLLYGSKLILVFILYGFLYRKLDRYLYRSRTDIYTEKIRIEVMEMTYETKMRKNAGSMIIVIPSPMVNMLGLKSGDSFEWNFKIEDNKPSITVVPKKKDEE